MQFILNNRNLYTWPKEMFQSISNFSGIDEIIIIDNDSSYEPLLDWYSENPCKIIKEKNIGHTAIWNSSIIDKIHVPYVYSDSDLGITNLPTNIIEILHDKLNNHKYLNKIGLGLQRDYISKECIYFEQLNTVEEDRYNKSRFIDDVYIDVHIDTTFAMYNQKHYFIGGGTYANHFIKHYPWEFTYDSLLKNEEFMYYLNNANESCSFKQILKKYKSTHNLK